MKPLHLILLAFAAWVIYRQLPHGAASVTSGRNIITATETARGRTLRGSIGGTTFEFDLPSFSIADGAAPWIN